MPPRSSLRPPAPPPAYIEPFYAGLGERVWLAREQANLTQEQLARRTGVLRTTVTNIETGRQRVLVHTLVKIAEVLNVAPSKLLGVE